MRTNKSPFFLSYNINMKLRDYQNKLISDTRNSFRCYKRNLCVAPCGAGKTIMFAYMCNEHINKFKDGYVWFLVHRQELIEQTIKTFDTNNINRNNILIGMVQTISRHIENYHRPTMIVFDEAHHSSAKTWLKILESYPDVPIIGLTATPCRLDGKPLGDIYNNMIQSVSAKWLIENKYLSPYKYFAPDLNLQDANWKIKGSDYDQKQVSEEMESRKIYGDVIKYIDLNKKTIIYAPSISLSKKISQEINTLFKSAVCAHFDGDTSDSERKKIIQDFRDGKIRILTNVDLIGEGFDVPDCNCVMLLRPTMSVALYIQQSMRCLRYKEDKIACIYDFVGNVFKHGLPDDDREWSLESSVKIKNKSNDRELLVRECKKCHRIYRGNQRICPYCEFDNGKTKKEIEHDREIELQEIKEIQKKQERREVGMCRDFSSLVQLGIKRGYKNPAYWAHQIINSRNRKI